jgi:hypothetical protein
MGEYYYVYGRVNEGLALPQRCCGLVPNAITNNNITHTQQNLLKRDFTVKAKETKKCRHRDDDDDDDDAQWGK